jgi:hypothetical protein
MELVTGIRRITAPSARDRASRRARAWWGIAGKLRCRYPSPGRNGGEGSELAEIVVSASVAAAEGHAQPFLVRTTRQNRCRRDHPAREAPAIRWATPPEPPPCKAPGRNWPCPLHSSWARVSHSRFRRPAESPDHRRQNAPEAVRARPTSIAKPVGVTQICYLGAVSGYGEGTGFGRRHPVEP